LTKEGGKEEHEEGNRFNSSKFDVSPAAGESWRMFEVDGTKFNWTGIIHWD
jgi:hypothetical protein